MTDLPELKQKNLNVTAMAERAAADRGVLEALITGVSPEQKKTAIRENSFKVLMRLSERHPGVLLRCWTRLVELLKSENSFSKYAAIHIVAALVPADERGLFDKAFGTYYGLLGDHSVMVASHVAGTSGKIARARPELQSKITKRLLDIDNTYPDAKRRELVKAYAIEALGEYFEESADKAKILAFVAQQVDSESPKTRKLARTFLEKWDSPTKAARLPRKVKRP